jgi:Holliday junction resolvasome RuvABC endonuclease subunit
VFGIDPSTKRMSAAVLIPASERRDVAFTVSTLSLPQATGDESRRLALQQREMVPWLGGLLRDFDPELVVVEEPFAGTVGKKKTLRVPKESYHVIGVLLAVIGQFGVRVERMGPTTWKSMALGAGNGMARKPGRGDDFEYAVQTWARAAGYDGTLWDECDAIGMATAGGVLLERERRAATG